MFSNSVCLPYIEVQFYDVYINLIKILKKCNLIIWSDYRNFFSPLNGFHNRVMTAWIMIDADYPLVTFEQM